LASEVLILVFSTHLVDPKPFRRGFSVARIFRREFEHVVTGCRSEQLQRRFLNQGLDVMGVITVQKQSHL
jgi:hypothetical protein